MKKLLLLSFIVMSTILMSLFLTTTIEAAGDKVIVTKTQEGNEAVLLITIENSQEIVGMQMAMVIDPSKLDFVKCNKKNNWAFFQCSREGNIVNMGGVVSLQMTNGVPAGRHAIAEAVFNVKQSTSISFQDISFNTVDASKNIQTIVPEKPSPIQLEYSSSSEKKPSNFFAKILSYFIATIKRITSGVVAVFS